jgi:hypothetical protein
VFAGFFAGHPSGLGPPPADAIPGWDAVATEPAGVVARLHLLIDAGADAVVLVPFGSDFVGQLQMASIVIVPQLRS